MTHCLGIDIGKEIVFVCVSVSGDPRRWPVHRLDLTLVDDLTHLKELATGAALAALEPTGWYYSRPVVTALQRAAVPVLEVAHAATKHTREATISRQKTDTTDARALALIAVRAAAGEPAIGCRWHDPAAADLTITLRLLLNDHRRAVKARTSAANRLNAFSYGLWPTLSGSKTYLRALGVHAVTPDDLRDLLAALEGDPGPEIPGLKAAYPTGNAVAPLRNLVAALPQDLPDPPPILREQILMAYTDGQRAALLAQTLAARVHALIWADPLAPVSQLWSTVPASCDLAFATLHAATHCRAQEFTPDQFRAAVGSHPSRQESGQVTETRDNKRGYRMAKTQLHLWTLRLLRQEHRPNPIADYFDKLKASGNKNAIHAARGKLARVLAGIARSGQPCAWAAAPAPVLE